MLKVSHFLLMIRFNHKLRPVQPNPSQNPSRNDYEDPNPAPEVSEAPETDYSYENPGVPDPYNSYDSNPSERMGLKIT